MADFFRFYWLCLKEAWRGLFDAANAWATILGAIVIYGALWLLGYRLILPETFEGAIGLAILSVVAAGVSLFVVRLVSAPVHLYMRAKVETDEARKVIASDAAKDRADALEAQQQHTAAIRAQTEAWMSSDTKDDPIEFIIPNVRVADLPPVLALFEHPEQDKLFPLLESGHLTGWARRMGPGEPPLNEVETSVWRSHHLDFYAKSGVQSKNQTFIKRNGVAETTYYDLFLCLEQIQKVWPTLRTGTIAASPSDIWKAAPEAVEAFAGSDLITERDKWKDAFEDATAYGHDAEDIIAALMKKMGSGMLGIDDTQNLNLNRRKLEVAVLQSDMAKHELRRVWDAIRIDVHAKLLRGHLIAKGFRIPHVAGSSETKITSAEWRIMDLNNVTSEANKNGSSEVLYSGVALRVAD